MQIATLAVNWMSYRTLWLTVTASLDVCSSMLTVGTYRTTDMADGRHLCQSQWQTGVCVYWCSYLELTSWPFLRQ